MPREQQSADRSEASVTHVSMRCVHDENAVPQARSLRNDNMRDPEWPLPPTTILAKRIDEYVAKHAPHPAPPKIER